MAWLIAAFFATAALYASVGFGGGSTYTALLKLAETDYRILPILSLICNIIVVTGGTFRFALAREIDWRRVMPIVIVSAVLAFIGGKTPIDEPTFMLVLALSLLASGVLLLVQRERSEDRKPISLFPGFHLAAGGAMGYIAGLVGIGGGIFLAPLLHLTGWGKARAIAATASLFILVNSLAGLAGQFSKSGAPTLATLQPWWPLAAAVLIGGQIGSHAGLTLFSPTVLRRATGVLILYVAGQLLWKMV